jgi:hypothetical protein
LPPYTPDSGSSGADERRMVGADGTVQYPLSVF